MMLQLKRMRLRVCLYGDKLSLERGHTLSQVNFSVRLYEKHGNPYARANSACPYSD